jgi:hypothetical protein
MGSVGGDGSFGREAPDPAGRAAPPPDTASPVTASTRLTGAEAMRLHLTLAGGLALCAAAFWFEVRRALGGNELSWAYVFEWPLFAGFAVYMWWQTLHQNRRRQRANSAPKVVAPEHVEMLRNWQAHVRDMAAAEAEAEAEARRADPGAAP